LFSQEPFWNWNPGIIKIIKTIGTVKEEILPIFILGD